MQKTTAPSVKNLAESYLNFFNTRNRDPNDLLELLAEDFRFKGPLGEFASRDLFLKDLQRDALAIETLHVRQILVDGARAAALYEVTSLDPAIGKVKLTDWIEVQNGQIISVLSTYDASAVRESLAQI